MFVLKIFLKPDKLVKTWFLGKKLKPDFKFIFYS